MVGATPHPRARIRVWAIRAPAPLPPRATPHRLLALHSRVVTRSSVSRKPSTRERLLRAAKIVFAERGYHGTRVSDIVREASVAQGTFYLHFAGKDDAFRQLIEGFFEVLLDDALGHSPPQEVSSPAEIAAQIRGVWRGALRRYHADRTLARLILREARCLDPEFADLIQQYYRRAADALVAYGRHPAVAPYLAEVDLEVAAWAILGMFESVAYQKIVIEGRDDVDDLADELLELELHGLLRRAPAARAPRPSE